MQIARKTTGHRPRELRRRVVLPARLQVGSKWSDTCILNISSRGMLIQTGQPAQQGTLVEIRRDRHVITGRVMWRAGGKVGLLCDERVPVDEILSLGASKSLQLIATEGALIERRRAPRHQDSEPRMTSRTLQFGAVLVISLILSVSGVLWIRTTLEKPLRATEAALVL